MGVQDRAFKLYPVVCDLTNYILVDLKIILYVVFNYNFTVFMKYIFTNICPTLKSRVGYFIELKLWLLYYLYNWANSWDWFLCLYTILCFITRDLLGIGCWSKPTEFRHIRSRVMVM